jgi:predicted nucleic acid-binding protein
VDVVDANVLLYAVNEDAERHEESVGWLDAALTGSGTVGFTWVSLLAFVRLSTKPGIFPSPLRVDDALRRVRAWLGQPTGVVLEPTARHLDVLGGAAELSTRGQEPGVRQVTPGKRAKSVS